MGLMEESILSVMLSRMTALLSLSNVRAAAAVLQVAGVPTAVSLGEAGTSASGLHS